MRNEHYGQKVLEANPVGAPAWHPKQPLQCAKSKETRSDTQDLESEETKASLKLYAQLHTLISDAGQRADSKVAQKCNY